MVGLPLALLARSVTRIAGGFLLRGKSNKTISFLAARFETGFLSQFLGRNALSLMERPTLGLAFGFGELLSGAGGEPGFTLLSLPLALGLPLGEVGIVQRRLGARAFELCLSGLCRRFEAIRKTFFLESTHAGEPVPLS